MMYRNLLAIEVEETLRSYPADGAVLMGGCDKTTPGLIMGAASAGRPAIYVPAGPMLRGNYRDQPVGSGTDQWKFWDDYRAGLIGDCELADLERGIARSPGQCMTMGTAATMPSAAEALGMTLPGAASPRRIPVRAHIRATGAYLMEDFYYAGGLPALLSQLTQVPGALHTGRVTANGRTLDENLAEAQVWNPDVIRPADAALSADGGLAVLRGNLAPDGAVIKPLAAEPGLLAHTGPAVVFDSYNEMQERIDDPALRVTPDSVLVLRGAGPRGGPGMPEYGMLPIPKYLLAQRSEERRVGTEA